MRSLKICVAVSFLFFVVIGCGGGGSNTPTTASSTKAKLVLVSTGEDLSDQNTLCGGTKKYDNPNTAIAGDQVDISLAINNVGDGPATDLFVKVSLPTGLSMVANSTLVDGVNANDLTSGFGLALTPNQASIIKCTLKVSGKLNEGESLDTVFSVSSPTLGDTSAPLVTKIAEPAVLCKK